MRLSNGPWWLWALLFFCWACIPANSSVHYKHHTKSRVLVVETRAFLPSHMSQVRQNEAIDRLGLHRYKNDKELRAAVKSGDLWSVPAGPWLSVSPRLPSNRRYVRPWVAGFLLIMGHNYRERFGSTLQVNSAVRTMQVQRSLLRWNHNAAPVHGDVASSHMAGATVDLQRSGLTLRQLFWIQDYLRRAGDRVIVIEELKEGSCFHIFINPPVEAPDVAH